MRVVAHRGFAGEAPENTLPAIRRAAAVADAVEVDVRRCGSGELVLLHDETLSRVAGVDASVRDCTIDELRALDVLGSGAGVPTLADAVAAVPDATPFVVECKEVGLASDVADVFADHEGSAMLASFSTAAIKEARRDAPSLPQALITGRLRDRPVTSAVELDCDALLAAWHVALVPAVDRAASRLDLPVYAWTVGSRTVAAALRRTSVQGLIVDDQSVLEGVRPVRALASRR